MPVCWSEEITKLARQHNDANIISIPARPRSIDNLEKSKKIIKIFLNESFEGGRHERRVKKNIKNEKTLILFFVYYR